MALLANLEQEMLTCCSCSVLIIQLCFVSIIVICLDELLEKGYGLVSSIQKGYGLGKKT